MFKAPSNQVAGHEARNGKLGPLIDDLGRFYKPLQDDDRGSKEVTFYKSFTSNEKVPDNIRKYVPAFYGTKIIEGSDGKGLRSHLVLQDVVSDYTKPCVMDVKIGSRTWYPQAPEGYFQKCIKKDRETTSLSLGFRISGLQIYSSEEATVWKPDRRTVQAFTIDDVKLVLRKFVSSESESDLSPDCVFASNVYGGCEGILAQLRELKAWFEDQTLYHFNSCSILIVYEKEGLWNKKNDLCPQIKLVDFAHVVGGNGVIDHNFLGGLCSLIKFVSEILVSRDGFSAKSSLPENEKNSNGTINDHQRFF